MLGGACPDAPAVAASPLSELSNGLGHLQSLGPTAQPLPRLPEVSAADGEGGPQASLPGCSVPEPGAPPAPLGSLGSEQAAGWAHDGSSPGRSAA